MPLSARSRKRLAEVKESLERAELERNEAIAQAWKDGGTVREIAEAVGLSHTWVSKLLHRMKVRRRLTQEEFDRYRGQW